MNRIARWVTFTVACLPAMAAFVNCAAQVTPPPPINTVMKSPDTVVRAKLQACNTAADCTRATVTPRCALDPATDVYCDTSDAGGQPIPPGKSGFCAFVIPVGYLYCPCFEGDIRYCDLNGWGSCTSSNLGGCGIQMCQKGPMGQDPSAIPPGPEWGQCGPQVAPVAPDAGTGTIFKPSAR
jgi:hypothetical protein